VVVESREAARKESGDLMLSKARIRAEVGEIFAGKKTVAASDTTVFKSVGVAIEDITTAKLALDMIASRREAGD
jgi:thiomorpholine-carboxylate dehydrogenase